MNGILKLIGINGAIGIILGAILGTLLVVQTHKTHVVQGQLDTETVLYQGEKIAHQKTIINYRTAAETARKADLANKQKVEAGQRAVGERTNHDYEVRIADAHARADRLRSQFAGAATNPGGSGTTPVPGVPNAPGGAGQAPGEDGLSPDDALTATEQAIQLDELIKWVRGVGDAAK